MPIDRRHFCAAGAAALLTPQAFAQFKVEISGVGATQLPIAVARFRDEDRSGQSPSAIIAADLERSGAFRIVDNTASLDETSQPVMGEWRARAADALVAGSVARLADGRFDVRFKLWDVVKGSELGGQSSAVEASEMRLAAHRIADFIYEKLTGEKGVFSTRIAYVTRAGGRHTLRVADADGESGQVALNSGQPIISPAWSPSGKELAYVSFERQKAVVFVHTVATGDRRAIADFRGSNSAPAWSPVDGTYLVRGAAVARRRLPAFLHRQGRQQPAPHHHQPGDRYRSAVLGRWQVSLLHERPWRQPAGLSHGDAARQGRARHLRRQLQHQPGGEPRRPHARLHRAQRQHLSPVDARDLSNPGAQPVPLTDTSDDEHPSFAPNGRLLIYATRVQGRSVLMTTTLDGKIKARLPSATADLREPVWGPYGR